VRCPTCGHENRWDARFCGSCRASLEHALRCSACAQSNPPDQTYCDHCGEPLPESHPDQPTPSPPHPIADSGKPRLTSLASGRYLVERFLGEGHRKRVYLARDTRLDRPVAIGLIKIDELDAECRGRIEREVRAMAQLGEHPHAVNIYDVGQESGLFYIVCQYVAGGSLVQRLQSAPNHRLPTEECLRIAEQLCLALEHAHDHGIIHRDITPGNVLLDEDGSAKLGDFGLAVAVEHTRLTLEGMIVGTVAYMPPEQALGLAPDLRSDLYALGALLYELVTGRPPFLGDNAVAIISQHINTAPVAPSWLDPNVSRPLEALILALLAKDPEMRPESAARVRKILREVASAPPETRDALPSQSNPLDGLAGGVFVGRESELERLRAGVDQALAGNLRILMLVGEPGIGKTRTAQELTTYARMRGAQTLWGRCYEGEGVPAYRPWAQIIRDYVRNCDPQFLRSDLGPAAVDASTLVSEIRERLPDLPPPPPLNAEDARFRLFEGIASLLRNASNRQPLAIVLDDLHWADKSSLLLLEFLAAELGPSRLLVVGTYREEDLRRHHPLPTTLARLSRSQQSERVQLRGLAKEDVARFIDQTSHRKPPAALVEAVYRETEGNPFFVHEVVRLLTSDGRLQRAAEIDSWHIEIPQGVREVVGQRLSHLSEACNDVLRVAAVLGRYFDARVLERVSELPENTLLEALDEALSARLVEEHERTGGYRFAHSLIQQTRVRAATASHTR